MHSPKSRNPSLSWIALASGLLLLAVYQTAEAASKWRLMRTLHRLEHPESVHYSYVGKDHPPEMPAHIPQAAMNIEWPDDELYGIYADDEWLSLFPRSNGWVALGPQSEMFVVSMFHQLHCLDALRYGYATAKASVLAFPGNGTGVEHHVNHCLTYLKEIVLCRGDTTLEESELMRNPEGRMEHGAAGVDMVHRCRDWTKVREWMEGNFDERLAKGVVYENGTEIVPGYNY